MGYAWVYLGDAELPATALDAWLACTTAPDTACVGLDAALVDDFGLAAPDLATVREVLESLDEAPTGEVTLGPTVRVRVHADKSGDAWLTHRAALVAAFVRLREHGGRGTLEVVGDEVGPDEGFRLEVDDSIRLVALGADQVAWVRKSEAYAQSIALVNAAYPPPDLDQLPPPLGAPPPGSYLDHVMKTVAARVFPDLRDGLKRIQRHVLWTLHAEGALEPAVLAERAKARYGAPGAVAEAAAILVEARSATVWLVEPDGPRLRLAPIAAEALADVERDDPTAFIDGKGADTRVLSLPVPFLFVAGAQGIGVGMQCRVPPAEAAVILEAALDRLATPPRPPKVSLVEEDATVLVGGVPVALNGTALLDGWVADRRATLARRGVSDVDARMERDLRRWLGPG